MTISFFEPGDVPQPPDQVKIEHLNTIVHPDGWRVKTEIHVTPFQQRPNLEVTLWKQSDGGQEFPVAQFSIVETMHPRMEFHLHIRGVDDPIGNYRLRALLYYRDSPKEGSLEVPPMQVKDQCEIEFTISERQ